MIFNKLFRPRWEHADPQVRRRALAVLAPGDPTLHQMARNDPDASVRASALTRLVDPDLLLICAREDDIPECRAAAGERLAQLLEGRCEGAPALDERIAFMLRWDATGVAERLVREAEEADLRLAALGRVRDRAVLATVALTDPATEVRVAAIGRVTDQSVLEQVARDARGRNKNLYRTARERLDGIRLARTQHQRATDICVEVERLTGQEDHLPDLGRLHQLDLAWSQLPADCRDEARFGTARERVLERVNAAGEAANRRRNCLAALEHLAVSVADHGTEAPPTFAQANATLEALIADWAAASHGVGGAEQRQFETARAAVRESLFKLERDQDRASRRDALLHQAGQLLGSPGAIPERDILALEQAWQEQPEPSHSTLTTAQRLRWGEVRGRLQERLRQQESRLGTERTELTETLAALETAVDDGTLQEALALRDRLRQQLGESVAMPRRELAQHEAALRRLEPALGELRDWRRWGTRQVREQLCSEAEALPGRELPAAEIATELKGLRRQWKALDTQSGPAPQNLWQRFDAACNRAYEPVRAVREAEANKRAEARERRLALCAEAEAAVSAIDWAAPQWRALEQLRQSIEDRWAQAGAVERRDRRTLDKRMRAALAPLAQQLEEERAREQARRRELLEQLTIVAEGDDLALATRTAKAVQAQWTPTVRLARRDEDALWKQLRELSDRIFARRDGERQRSEDDRRKRVERLERLCEQVETLADQPLSAPLELERITEQWRELTRESAAEPSLEQRFRSAAGEARRVVAMIHGQERRAHFRTLALQAALCREMEAAALRGIGGDDAAAWDLRWSGIGRVQDPAQERLDARYLRARAALGGDSDALAALVSEAPEGTARRYALCLDLEILTGLESPPELADERLRRKVSRLSDSLSGGAGQAVHGDEALERLLLDWLSLSCSTDETTEALEARFDRILASLEVDAVTS